MSTPSIAVTVLTGSISGCTYTQTLVPLVILNMIRLRQLAQAAAVLAQSRHLLCRYEAGLHASLHDLSLETMLHFGAALESLIAAAVSQGASQEASALHDLVHPARQQALAHACHHRPKDTSSCSIREDGKSAIADHVLAVLHGKHWHVALARCIFCCRPARLTFCSEV